MMPLYQFLSGKQRNAWVRFPEYHLDIYLRKSFRKIFTDEECESIRMPHRIRQSAALVPESYSHGRKTLDLASVTVDEEFQGQGHHTRFITDVEFVCKNTGHCIYVENVLEVRLNDFFKKRGYREVQHRYTELTPPCYFKPCAS